MFFSERKGIAFIAAAMTIVCMLGIILSFEISTTILEIPLPVTLTLTDPLPNGLNRTTTNPRPNGRCLSCFKWKFPVIISPQNNLCYLPNGQKIDLISVVPSKHENIRHRDLLREMFNSSQLEKHNIRVLFAFGKHPKAVKEMERDLQSEARAYGDIVQADVIGSYKNLTLLAYNAFNWVAEFCQNARFVLKTTDDVIFNVPGILKLLDMKGGSELSDVVFGLCMSNAGPMRGAANHKWSIGKAAYPFRRYPSVTPPEAA